MRAVSVIVAVAVCGSVVSSVCEAATDSKPTPKINSITFSAPVPLKAGDIITVDLAGTPGAKAAFSVRNLISVTYLKEVSPGAYHGSVKVPSGKTVRNAPLVGYLRLQDAHAPPMQAARLITVAPPEKLEPIVAPLGMTKPGPKPLPEPSKLPRPTLEPAPDKPTPPGPASSSAPAQEETRKASVRNDAKIILTSPTDGAIVRRAIVVQGTAEPHSVVRVTITYSNQLNGILKLAGEVVSQNLSAGSNGQFRMGPIPLDGHLATPGLKFTIKAYYPDKADHGTAVASVIGNRD